MNKEILQLLSDLKESFKLRDNEKMHALQQRLALVLPVEEYEELNTFLTGLNSHGGHRDTINYLIQKHQGNNQAINFKKTLL